MSDGTRSKSNQTEMEGIANMLQEMLRNMEVMDSRLGAVENRPQLRVSRDE